MLLYFLTAMSFLVPLLLISLFSWSVLALCAASSHTQRIQLLCLADLFSRLIVITLLLIILLSLTVPWFL